MIQFNLIKKRLQSLFQPDLSPLPLLVLWLLCGYFIISCLFIASKTIPYPYQMEWLEGAVMDVVQQVLQGLPIYTAPTLKYPPFLYTPLYFYVTAAFTHLFGNDLLAGRMVSLCSIIAVCVILYAWLRKEDTTKFSGWLAIALFLSTYEAAGRWFFLARVDNLFLALTFGGLFVYAHYRSHRSAILAGVLLTLAFFTKQQAFMILLPPMILGLPAFPKRTLITLSAFIILSGIMIAAYEHASGGWFSIYVFGVPLVNPTDCLTFTTFWQDDILRHMPIALGFSAFGVMGWLAQDWRKGLLYLGLLAGALGSSMASRMHCGGWENVLTPSYITLSIVCVLAVYGAIRSGVQRNICFILLAVQLLMLIYNPFAMVPQPENYAAGKKQMDYLAHLHGEVFIPGMRFVQTKAGKTSYGCSLETEAADQLRKDKTLPSVHDQVVEAVMHQKFSAIILEENNNMLLNNPYYKFKEKILSDNTTYLLTGIPVKPNLVYVPVPQTTKPKK